MRKKTTLFLVLGLAFFIGASQVSAGNGSGSGGDGMFANMFQYFRDDDGDGIPNGQDEDWVPPEDGSGYGTLTFTGTDGSFLEHRYQLWTRTRTETQNGDANGIMTRLRDRIQQVLSTD